MCFSLPLVLHGLLPGLVPLLLATVGVPSSATPEDGSQNYRPLASYDLRVRLDPESRMLRGEGEVRWTNGTDNPTDRLCWHLYLNAFRNNRSVFMRESSGGKLRGDAFDGVSFGYTQLQHLERVGQAKTQALLPSARFGNLDGAPTEDETVLVVPLDSPVQAGQTAVFRMAFEAKLPRVFARSGQAGDFFMVAQWFPKLGVLTQSKEGEPPQWNCHPYHAHSEFFSDYGAYRVAIQVPKDFVVGATGRRVAERKVDEDTVEVVYAQDRVHDFAFAADRRFREVVRTFAPAEQVSPDELAQFADLLDLPESALALGPVEVRLLYQPEHEAYVGRYFDALFQAIKGFGLRYGAYPYETLTVIDGPRAAMGAMGMEYPTLMTAGVHAPSPKSNPSPELVTIHEFGHQYWYGLVGTNEFEAAWLDEGFNTYSTGRVLDAAYGAFAYAPRVLGFPLAYVLPGVHLTQEQMFRLYTLARPDMDPIDQPAWLFRDALSYGVNSYGRPAFVLSALERRIGSKTFAQLMRAYHLRFRYRHPKPDDFFAMAEQASGQDLQAFFRDGFRQVGFVDYAVSELTTTRKAVPQGYFGSLSKPVLTSTVPETSRPYVTTVVLERIGALEAANQLVVRFQDGTVLKRTWDGQGRWKRFELETSSPAVSAEIDPGDRVGLDINRSNNSRVVVDNANFAVAWGKMILFGLQWLAMLGMGLLG